MAADERPETAKDPGRAAPPHMARRLLDARCDCGRPATTIHIIHPDDAGRPPRAASAPRRSSAHGPEAFARPACGAHTHGGYAIDLTSLLTEWHERLDALRREGIDGEAVLRGLVRRISPPRSDTAEPRSPRPAHRGEA